MNINTVFVASTFPARFLLDSWLSLNVSWLIFGPESLKSSFQVLSYGPSSK